MKPIDKLASAKGNIRSQFPVLAFVFSHLLAAETLPPITKPTQSFELTGGSTRPSSVVFSKDFKQLASSGILGEIEVWSVEQGSRLGEWKTDARTGSSVAFLTDPTELLVASGTNVAVHDALTGKVIRTLEAPPAKVAAISLSPERTRAVAALDNFRQSAFWDLADGKLISRLPTKPRSGLHLRTPGGRPLGMASLPVTITPGMCQAFNRQGNLFAAGQPGHGVVDIWDLENGQCLHSRKDSLFSGSMASGLAFLTDQQLVAVFDQSQLTIFTLDTKASTNLLQSPIAANKDSLEIRSLAVSGDGKRLAVAGMRMGKRPGVWAPKGDMVFDVPMHGEVQLWDTVGMKLIVTIQGKPSEKFGQVALDDSGQRLITVTTGVAYNPRMSGPTQHSEQAAPKNPLRVSVWKLPPP